MIIPEQIKDRIKVCAKGLTPEEYFNANQKGGFIKTVYLSSYPVLATDVIIDRDEAGFVVDQNLLRSEYWLTRSMVYDILR